MKTPLMKSTQISFSSGGDYPGLVGSLYAPNKPIGMILADRDSGATELADTDFATFSLILSQTNTNLARLAQSH